MDITDRPIPFREEIQPTRADGLNPCCVDMDITDRPIPFHKVIQPTRADGLNPYCVDMDITDWPIPFHEEIQPTHADGLNPCCVDMGITDWPIPFHEEIQPTRADGLNPCCVDMDRTDWPIPFHEEIQLTQRWGSTKVRQGIRGRALERPATSSTTPIAVAGAVAGWVVVGNGDEGKCQVCGGILPSRITVVGASNEEHCGCGRPGEINGILLGPPATASGTQAPTH